MRPDNIINKKIMAIIDRDGKDGLTIQQLYTKADQIAIRRTDVDIVLANRLSNGEIYEIQSGLFKKT